MTLKQERHAPNIILIITKSLFTDLESAAK